MEKLQNFRSQGLYGPWAVVAVVNSINSKTHPSKEMADFCSENADDKSICYCKQRVKSTLSFSSECVKTKL